MKRQKIFLEVVVQSNYPRKRFVKSVNSRCARSQRQLGRQFPVHYSTISRDRRQ